ncbi:hypothetical protein ABTX81_06225 [Kitasatospora sp. NPDC097605]|uniref:hypothetical protein n=1 Tax=Kitasatospora sp. NPDC097605 TaxID=3157226 RepID=UPI00332D0B79
MNEHMKRDKGRKRAPFGTPKDIILLATPHGWRHSLITSDGGFVCGHLPDVPVEDAEQAKERAAAMLSERGREFHGTVFEVVWEESTSPGSWTGHIHQCLEAQPAEADHLGAGS